MIIGFRVNEINDRDLLNAIEDFTQGTKSDRIKDLIRKGLKTEAIAVDVLELPPIATVKPLIWNIPKEPTIRR
jgi:hypothetical protein